MKRLLLIMSAILLIVIAACGAKGAATTVAPGTVETAQGGLVCTFAGEPGPVVLVNTSTFTDYLDDLHIVGLVRNTDAEAQSYIEFTLTVKDAQGQTLLTDFDGNPVDNETFYPLLDTLVPNETSPFDTYVSLDEGIIPASCTIAFSTATSTSVERGDVTTRNVRSVTDYNGNLYIFGELVNNGNTPAHISSLAGAGVDGSGNVLAASYSMNLVEYLAPAGDPNGLDHGPFGIMIWGPVGPTAQPQVFIDTEVYDTIAAPAVTLEVTSVYLDQYDYVHVVGTATNNGDSQLSFYVQTTLLDTGGQILDTYYVYLPFDPEPGQMIPFDQTSWAQIDFNDAEKESIDHAELQIDPYWVMNFTTQLVYMMPEEITGTDMGSGSYSVTGTVINNSSGPMSTIVVIAYLTDASGKVVGTSYRTVYPEQDVIAPGTILPFEIQWNMPVDTDFSSLSLNAIVIGEVPSQ